MIVATPPSRERASIQSMRERHHEIKRLLIAGVRQRDIAAAIGMTESRLSIVIASPVFQAELALLRRAADAKAADVGQRIKDLAPDAMTVLEQAVRGRLMPDGSRKNVDGINEVHKVRIAQDALDRAGHGKPMAQGSGQANVTVQIVQFSAPATPAPAPSGEKETIIDAKVEVPDSSPAPSV